MGMSEEGVKQFVENTEFEVYQGFNLPYGFRIPGQDRSSTASLIFPDDLSGKSVLTIGSFYGFFPNEAKKRGAERVVGIEINEKRVKIAEDIARILDNDIEFRVGDFMDIEIKEEFDFVLLLNVLHHVADPISVVRKAVRLCNDIVVCEFCLPEHRIQKPSSKDLLSRIISYVRFRKRYLVIKMFLKDEPLVVVSPRADRNTDQNKAFYFSREAFRNTFVIHNRFFSNVVFKPSPHGRDRAIAFCKVV